MPKIIIKEDWIFRRERRDQDGSGNDASIRY